MNKIKNNTKKDYKYKCKKLDYDSVEHKIVRDFFDVTSTIYPQKFSENTDFNVYKISKRNTTKTLEEKRNNLMLFHGTNKKSARGIVKHGFKNSTKGWFGKGVYMTDCSYIARSYCFGMYGFDYVFVNEVLESDKLKTFEYSRYETMFDEYTKPKHSFEKYFFEGSHQPTMKDYKEDTLGRKYRNIEVKGISKKDEYLADESLVIPRHLIVTSGLQIFDFEDELVEFEKIFG